MTSPLLIVLAVVLSAAAVIGVLLWRLRPLPSGDVESLQARLAEATQHSQVIQGKLDAREAQAASCTADAAAARAGMEAAEKQAAGAEQRLASVTAEHKDLARRWEALAPQVERAKAESEAARAAADTLRTRVESLEAEGKGLRTELQVARDRAAEAESAAAGHGERAAAAEEARAAIAGQLTEAIRRNDVLSAENRRSVERMATSETEAENLKARMGEMGRMLETVQQELTSARADLVVAVSKHQADEAAARQFENISDNSPSAKAEGLLGLLSSPPCYPRAIGFSLWREC